MCEYQNRDEMMNKCKEEQRGVGEAFPHVTGTSGSDTILVTHDRRAGRKPNLCAS